MSFFREKIVKPLTRSGGWSKRRKEKLVINPACEACGATKGLEVHHVEPFHLDPSKELDMDNLITLCGKWCHFVIGHLLSWKSYNRHVRMVAAYYLKLVKGRP